MDSTGLRRKTEDVSSTFPRVKYLHSLFGILLEICLFSHLFIYAITYINTYFWMFTVYFGLSLNTVIKYFIYCYYKYSTFISSEVPLFAFCVSWTHLTLIVLFVCFKASLLFDTRRLSPCVIPDPVLESPISPRSLGTCCLR